MREPSPATSTSRGTASGVTIVRLVARSTSLSILPQTVDVDAYIAKHRPEWQALDTACRKGAKGMASLSGPEIAEVVRLYQRASSHLAEARTRYHDPALHEYLNRLVGRAHAAVYSGRPRTVRGFLSLFGARYREAFRRTAPFIAVAAVVLVAVALATDLWIASSPEARAGIVPPAARDAIRHATGGRAAEVGPAVSTFILVNNVQVALLAFALGITLGIGTLWIVVQNAVLLGLLGGAFQGLGKASVFWALVLPHGLLELTAICIAAGAGLRMGWSMVAPGDRPRTTALAEEATQAVLVVVGVVPAFAVAAFIEGFVTGTAVPNWIEIGLGAAVAAAYVAFLVGLPRRRSPTAPRPVTAGPGP